MFSCNELKRTAPYWISAGCRAQASHPSALGRLPDTIPTNTIPSGAISMNATFNKFAAPAPHGSHITTEFWS